MQQKERTDKSDSKSLTARLAELKRLIPLILLTSSPLPAPARAQSPVGETAQEPAAVGAAPVRVGPRDLSVVRDARLEPMTAQAGACLSALRLSDTSPSPRMLRALAARMHARGC